MPDLYRPAMAIYREDPLLMFRLFTLFFCAFMLSAQEFYPTECSVPGQWFLDSISQTRTAREQFYRTRLDKLDPAPERSRLAEEFHRTLEEKFISNRIEDHAIESALQWPQGDFTWHNNRFYARTGCTSWFIHPSCSSSGSAILQKNRDYTGQNLISCRLYRAMPGRYKVLTTGDLWSSGAGAVMNEKGVMITQNDGRAWETQPRRVSIGSTFLLRYLAEHCATADAALNKLKEFYNCGFMRDGDIYFIADPRTGYAVEATACHIVHAEIPFGFEVRANNYLLPGMRSLGHQQQKHFLNGANRRYTASEFLRVRLQKNGKISPSDLMDLARLRDAEQEKMQFRQICMKNTIASTMMVPDAMFPQYLSAAFVAIGPPRHTIFLPVPMAATQIPADLTNGEWGAKAFSLQDKMGMDHNKLAEFKKLENALTEEFFETKERARKLLLQGKINEAVTLLDQCFLRQYRRASAFLNILEP